MQLDSNVQQCVEACLRCYSRCLSTAMLHCLEAGGKHTEPAHFRLMMSCAEICQAAAYFMLIGSSHHPHLCRECAEICLECADDCERIGDMADCVDSCRQCAESCRQMAA
ncbi:four-helix bundle copper-binding protein [Rhizobium tropici]|uniref:Four-helix bundle copper-binding protein n=1 Tax=Rhizobium tropici TaxID=398 RepID=A0A329YA66_RHITR|nr:four-helix bundle copper-binding protein [Rhizobium tropici]RAX37370.1 four-helix bundle copper-binding protein [Rhizobium tropici]